MNKEFTLLKKVVLATTLCFCCLTAAAEDDQNITVTIPASGHLAFKSDRNFTGPSSIIVSNFYGSANNTSKGLVFQNQQLGEEVVIACSAGSSSGLILTAQPGTYTLTLTDRTATKQFFSTSVSWIDEAGIVDETSKSRAVYKFVNEPDRVGFQRDEKYAEEKYYKCDMAEGEHVYFAIGEKNMERICDTMNTTAAELSFISWDKNLWGCPLPEDATGIMTIEKSPKTTSNFFDLQGVRLNGLQKGINIVNGRKVVVK